MTSRRSHWPVALSLACLVSLRASAEELTVYYDYVEGGTLRGGRLVIDPANPVHRADFGLDGDGAGMRGWAVTTVMDNGPTANRVDVVMLGDGYTAGELGAYAAHVTNVLNQFFAEEPFDDYAGYFNVHRVDVISNQSGVDEPAMGIFRDTALDMTYDCSGIDRLLCINLTKAAAASSVAPDVDQTLALANSTRYGGAGYPGNDLGTLAGNNGLAVEIALHEFGHSFANLADEYDYGGPTTYSGPEPGEANLSIYTAAQQVAQLRKWWRWMDLPQVDTFVGGGYSELGIYRPTFNSKMRALDRPFEEINVEQFVIFIYRTVSPIDDATPPSASPLPDGTMLFVTPMQPEDHNLSVQWSLDGADVAGATQDSFTPDYAALVPGVHQVSVRVADATSRVRDEAARAPWMSATRQWPVQVLPRDCNANGLNDQDDIAAGTSADCNLNSIPDECLVFEANCNANQIPDFCDIATAASADCDGNATPDECDIAVLDCNFNGTPDPCDIAGPASADCQGNGVPDECDIASAASADCNASAVPDECELAANDCNANSVPDECDLAGGTSGDCQPNGLPDDCDVAAQNTIYDCQGNGVPDGCDIAARASGDCNSNGIPDECDSEVCAVVWDGFELAPPFVVGAPIAGVDFNADGHAWQNPSGSATLGNQGCPASAGKALKIIAQTPPTQDFVSSEYFMAAGGGFDDGAPRWSLSFDARMEASLNPRIDWQLSVRDGVNGATAVLIHWASTQSNFAGVTTAHGGNGRGRILVQNPAGSPEFINTGFALSANACHTLRVDLDNLAGTVEVYVNGTLRVTVPRLQAGATRLDYFRLVQKANGQVSGNVSRLGLDNFELCRTGAALTPGGLSDCDGNLVLDACDLAQGVATDCNANSRLDSCDLPADYDGDDDVDLIDYVDWAACMTGPCDEPPCVPALYADPCCVLGDADADGDMDSGDFGALQSAFGTL